MKQIAKNEIFKNLSGFLKSRGIELTQGSYTEGIRQSCTLLTNAINLGQESLEKAKTEFEKTCENIKRAVHEKTAPKPPRAASAAKASPPPAGPAPAASPAAPESKARAAKPRPPKRNGAQTKPTKKPKRR